ncbi:hypothetical protein KQI49_14560 [Virgibacillus sp. MSJ-26]|uniref:hypothetical protein n=1 Tax=Virgibacillus sp. MSJ-26 TaxID=2841522 RepID=UPI001C1190A3|nr:hypothetical protein [Virgibacillus sp. MSJ-26]MBU5468048.1 hypothetical protein [Virgibacillus sp. MSJ-26]
MKWYYTFYAILLAALSIFTGEIVTFLMLGFILLSLNNINFTLKKILKTKQNSGKM